MTRTLVARPTEVRIEDSLLTQFLNPQFVADFRKAFPGAKFVVLRIAVEVGDKEGGTEERQTSSAQSKSKKKARLEPITIGHYAPDHEEKRVLTLECENPETLEAVERIIANQGAP
ncbi:MAG: hypothetical protein LVQ64_00290 [Thermoplasmatales archaeon]|nr:hypothetical protein [Thermoplasmatales archaeon]